MNWDTKGWKWFRIVTYTLIALVLATTGTTAIETVVGTFAACAWLVGMTVLLAYVYKGEKDETKATK